MKKLTWRGTAYLFFILLLMYLPIFVVVLFSFNANTARSPTLFTGFSLQWYQALFDSKRGFGAALGTSLELALYSVGLSTVLGTLGALGLTRRTYKKTLGGTLTRAGTTAIENIATLPIMIPEIILGIAFMAMFTALKLPFGMPTLVLAHTTFCVPYIYIIVKSRLSTMDDQLVEAARDLGANPLQAFFTVTLPLIVPAIVSGALLALAMSLDDFVISFFVNGPDTNTLPLRIYASVKVGVSTQVNALCTVMLLVVFALAALSQGVLRKK